MLSFLRIQGLAVIDELQLELSPGLNVLTGETGAGKSIIVTALSLLRGAKGSARAVRAECERALVQAQFVVPEGGAVMQVLRGLELPSGDGERREVVLERVVPRSGRGRALIQGQLRPQPQLAEVGERLIDICGQHQQHSLARLGRHLELLDEHARSRDKRFSARLEAYQARFAELRGIERELERLREMLAQDPALGDYLEHQLNELIELDPQPGEWEGVRERLDSLRRREESVEAVRLVESELEESDGAVLPRLAALERQLRALQVGEFAALSSALSAAAASCEEALVEARRALCVEDDAEESLQRLEERQHQLAVLRRKHGPALCEARERLEAQVDEWRSGAERIAALDVRREQALAAALEIAAELHERRCEVAQGLAREVECELESLCMPLARIEIAVERLPAERIHGAGVDRVELRVSANPGEPAGPLSEVASGGELSRILLALQSVSNAGGGVATYVFDEVDAGVGGAVADAIGRRLLRAARSGHGDSPAQVLCITHLPQVAAFADAQFRVEKLVEAGRTRTRVVRLGEAERVEELARMLGGAEVTDSARHHAQRLLDAAAALKGAKRARTRASKRGTRSRRTRAA